MFGSVFYLFKCLIFLISQRMKCELCFEYNRASLVAQLVKNLPAVQEAQGSSLGQEDPLEKRMVTHSSILAWRIPWIEEPGGRQSMECFQARVLE